MTKGALRSTLPIDPPIVTASVVTAMKAISAKKPPAIQKSGCWSW